MKLHHGVWRDGLMMVKNVHLSALNKDIRSAFLRLMMELGLPRPCGASLGAHLCNRLAYAVLLP